MLVAWAIGLLLLYSGSRVIPATPPTAPPIVYAPGPLGTGLAAVALAAIAWWCARTRFAGLLDPRNEALFLGGLVFLAVCQAAVCVLRSLTVLGLISATRVHLLYEIPARLSGIEYIVGAAVGVLALWLIFRDVEARFGLASRTFLAGPLWRGMAVALMAATLVIGRMDTYGSVLSGQANFFARDCAQVPFRPVTREALSRLDPRAEPEFFYALGELLFGGE